MIKREKGFQNYFPKDRVAIQQVNTVQMSLNLERKQWII